MSTKLECEVDSDEREIVDMMVHGEERDSWG